MSNPDIPKDEKLKPLPTAREILEAIGRATGVIPVPKTPTENNKEEGSDPSEAK